MHRNARTSQLSQGLTADREFDKPRDPVEWGKRRLSKETKRGDVLGRTTVPPPASQIMNIWLGFSLCRSVKCAQWTAAASGSLNCKKEKKKELIRNGTGDKWRRAYVMMRRRSRQSRSRAPTLRTRPAVMAASRIISQPLASHAAGTVNQTSAESAMMDGT